MFPFLRSLTVLFLVSLCWLLLFPALMFLQSRLCSHSSILFCRLRHLVLYFSWIFPLTVFLQLCCLLLIYWGFSFLFIRLAFRHLFLPAFVSSVWVLFDIHNIASQSPRRASKTKSFLPDLGTPSAVPVVTKTRILNKIVIS